jgi:hypothetical protein
MLETALEENAVVSKNESYKGMLYRHVNVRVVQKLGTEVTNVL